MDQFRKVFVYGTLKRGEPNHHWFSKTESGSFRFIGEGRTVEKYPLLIGTKFNIPFLLHSPGNGYNVRGELYEVDEKVFADLDVLENHPDFYQRHERQIELENKKIVTAWVYFIMNFREELLQQKMYECYKDNTDGKKYLEGYLRGVDDDFKQDILK